MKFLDLFSGIGGFRLGLERAGHECIGYVEIDKYARKSYEAMHNTEGEWVKHDITAITNEEWAELKGRVDIIAGGFPCQAFSIAGKRGGFEDTRGTLFFDIARAAKEIQPSYLFLENVKGLFSHDKGRTFGTIIQVLDELGYFVEWGLFNSKFWGVPQNRERVFIIATRKDVYEKPILFDLLKQQEQNGINVKLRDILETEVDEKFYLSEEQTDRLVFNMSNKEKPDNQVKLLAHRKSYHRNTQVFDKDGLTETLDTGQGGGRGHYTMEDIRTHSYNRKDGIGNEIEVGHTIMARDYKGFGNQDMSAVVECGLPIKEVTNQGVVEVAIGASRGRYSDDLTDGTTGAPTEQRLEINQDEISNTLTSVQKDNYVVSKPPFRIRKLTPLECFKLQGFQDELFYKAQDVNSNSQLYKQAGNSVTVNVIEAIANRLTTI